MIIKSLLCFFLSTSFVYSANQSMPLGGRFLTQILEEDEWDLMKEGARIRIQPIEGKPFYGFGQRYDSAPKNVRPFDFSADNILLQCYEITTTLREVILYLKQGGPKNSAFDKIIEVFFALNDCNPRPTLLGFRHPQVRQYTRSDGSMAALFSILE